MGWEASVGDRRKSRTSALAQACWFECLYAHLLARVIIKAGLEMAGLPVGEPRRRVFGLDAQGRDQMKTLLDALRQG